MNNLEIRIAKLEATVKHMYELGIFDESDEDDGVIRKVGNKWKILKKNRKDYWDADYDTKADAQAALRAYWANHK